MAPLPRPEPDAQTVIVGDLRTNVGKKTQTCDKKKWMYAGQRSSPEQVEQLVFNDSRQAGKTKT